MKPNCKKLNHEIQLKCINCGIATQRLRRHNTSSLPRLLLTILARWLSIEVPMDANICHPCFKYLSSELTGDFRLFGHTMVCITCGRSVRSIQNHAVERNNPMLQNLPKSHPAFYQVMNYLCHPCWMRHQRHSNLDQNRVNLPGPERAPTPVPELEIHLPHYKQAANSSTHYEEGQDPVGPSFKVKKEKNIPKAQFTNSLKKTSRPRIKKPKQEFYCFTCNEDFFNWEELEIHLIQHVSLPSLILYQLPSSNEDNLRDQTWLNEDDVHTYTPLKLERRQSHDVNMENIVLKIEIDNGEPHNSDIPLLPDQIKSESASSPPLTDFSSSSIVIVKVESELASTPADFQPLFSNTAAMFQPIVKTEDTGMAINEINHVSNYEDEDNCMAAPTPDVKPIVPKIENPPASVTYPSLAYSSSLPSFDWSTLCTTNLTEGQHSFHLKVPGSNPTLDRLENSKATS